ncbi:hypothetical protein JZ785_17345 [Alicyclobacillus curvatus]|nr:hypothetical protein JZ785_17345 [Alicyclobacillus curvatus]
MQDESVQVELVQVESVQNEPLHDEPLQDEGEQDRDGRSPFCTSLHWMGVTLIATGIKQERSS